MKKNLIRFRVILGLIIFLFIMITCSGSVFAQTSIDDVSKSVVRIQEDTRKVIGNSV